MKNIFISFFISTMLLASVQQTKASDPPRIPVDLSRLPSNFFQIILLECDYQTVNGARLVSTSWRKAIDNPKTGILLPNEESQLGQLLSRKSPLEVFKRASNTKGGLLRLASLDVFFPTWFDQFQFTENDRKRIILEVTPLLRDGGSQIPEAENLKELSKFAQYCSQLKLLVAVNKQAYDLYNERLLKNYYRLIHTHFLSGKQMSLKGLRICKQIEYCTTFSAQKDQILRCLSCSINYFQRYLYSEEGLLRQEIFRDLKRTLSVFKCARKLEMKPHEKLGVLDFISHLYDTIIYITTIDKDKELGIDKNTIVRIVIDDLNSMNLNESLYSKRDLRDISASIIRILDRIKIKFTDPRLNKDLRNRMINVMKDIKSDEYIGYLKSLSREEARPEIAQILDSLETQDRFSCEEVLENARRLNALRAHQAAAKLIQDFLHLDQADEVVRQIMDQISIFSSPHKSRLHYLLRELAETGDQVSLKRVTSLLSDKDMNRYIEGLKLCRSIFVEYNELVFFVDVLKFAGEIDKATEYFKFIPHKMMSGLSRKIKYLQLGIALGQIPREACIKVLDLFDLLSDDAYGEILDESLNVAFLYKVLGQPDMSEKLVERYVLSHTDAITALQSLVIATQAGLVDSKFCENILLTRFADISEKIKYDPTIPQDINKWILILYIHHLAGNKDYAEKMWQEIYEKHLSTKYHNRFRPLIIELLQSNISIGAEEDERDGFIKTAIDSGSYEGLIAAFDAFFAIEMNKWNKEHHQ